MYQSLSNENIECCSCDLCPMIQCEIQNERDDKLFVEPPDLHVDWQALLACLVELLDALELKLPLLNGFTFWSNVAARCGLFMFVWYHFWWVKSRAVNWCMGTPTWKEGERRECSPENRRKTKPANQKPPEFSKFYLNVLNWTSHPGYKFVLFDVAGKSSRVSTVPTVERKTSVADPGSCGVNAWFRWNMGIGTPEVWSVDFSDHKDIGDPTASGWTFGGPRSGTHVDSLGVRNSNGPRNRNGSGSSSAWQLCDMCDGGMGKR